MQAAVAKKISCKRCQKRKIRCSRTHPCINCSTARVSCEFRNDGSRKFPISRDYVASLEARVAVLESFITNLKAASSSQRDSMIKDIDFLDHYETNSGATGSVSAEGVDDHDESAAAASIQESGEGSLAYHGPTSIYSGALAGNGAARMGISEPPLPLTHNLDTGEKGIAECIALFFNYQYPQFMFIDREAFILDFQSRQFSGQFCSSALVNAICSVGALMSPHAEVRSSAPQFAESALSLLFCHGLAKPHITSVQTLLCCAFYEIGAGNFSRGWLYSGMAFRMGQDLGFHRDPSIWNKRYGKQHWAEDEFRRRIYWGCYISDKFFSLFLGRSSVMHESDADVRQSTPMPQDKTYENWAKARGFDYLRDQLQKTPRLCAVFNKQVEIGTIISEGLSVMYSPRKTTSLDGVKIALNAIIAKLTKFMDDLPSDMRLREFSSLSDPLQPHVAVLHMLHNSTLISLARPLLTPEKPGVSTGGASLQTSSAVEDICAQCVERIITLLKRFRAQHGLRHAPLAFTHGAIVAVNAVLSLAGLENDLNGTFKGENLATLKLALEEMSLTWNIAGTTLVRLRSLRLSNEKGKLPETEDRGTHSTRLGQNSTVSTTQVNDLSNVFAETDDDVWDFGTTNLVFENTSDSLLWNGFGLDDDTISHTFYR